MLYKEKIRKIVHGISLLILFLMMAGISRKAFSSAYPGAGRAEFCLYFLNNPYFCLVLMPLVFLCIVSRNHPPDARGYEALLITKYGSRNSFFRHRLKEHLEASFLFFFIAGISLALTSYRLPGSQTNALVATDRALSVILKMLLNLLCFHFLMSMVYEVFYGVTGRIHLALLLAASIPLGNLVLVKLYAFDLLPWTPWGNIAYYYTIYYPQGNEILEKTSYHFGWWYWLSGFLLLYGYASHYNTRKDYPFRQPL